MSTSILPWLNENKKTKVAVLGDLILDEYLEGDVRRISPEAPVPVHLVSNTYQRAGGAANVALNIKLVGGEVGLFSVWGDDESAKNLREILESYDVSTQSILVDPSRPTSKKTRISAGRQQIVRIDWEKIKPISEANHNELLTRMKSEAFDAVLVSDYGKGCLTEEFLRQIFDLYGERKIPVIVDPKGKDYGRYCGSFIVTPNRSEACEALGLSQSDHWSPEKLASGLVERFKLSRVLLTLGSAGMYYYSNQGESHYLPAVAREVYDVSGAGDTVASILALAIGSGGDIKSAMNFANAAAGRVIAKWGTQPINREELCEALSDTHATRRSSLAKIVKINELKETVCQMKDSGKRIVFTNGCFDILHAGHVTYLEEARSRGDVLVVGINSDQSVRKIKGHERPVIECSQRMRLVAALECVDFVVSFDEDTPEKLISFLLPSVLIKGADWAKDKIVGADVVTDSGGIVDNVELVPGLSTSDIIRRVRDGKSVNLK